ncbi:hypothetical protein [Gordonia westfalica]|uniref:Uncharacterized protein n=1 Tax=Gordonia westfalica TaxID=158898 RepID=A0A1H2IM62_9ACTN|nr:hypothetical protein [Gordonia westfalica]SDU45111.1 hypothetical protein SAMN04488548_1341273 [Gordonia westfalica]
MTTTAPSPVRTVPSDAELITRAVELKPLIAANGARGNRNAESSTRPSTP